MLNMKCFTISSSKYNSIGVCWDVEREKWSAHIRLNGKLKQLGRFFTKIEAEKAYDSAAKRFRKNPQRLNENRIENVESLKFTCSCGLPAIKIPFCLPRYI